jgi:hypothetical protein
MEIFTNKNGNHVIVNKLDYPASTKSLIYYNLNTAGSIISSYTIETISSGIIEFPKISGNDDKLYIVYRLGGEVKTWKSTNVGINWNLNSIIYVSNNTCMGVDLAFGNNSLHVVWSLQDKGSDYATYYQRFDNGDNLVDYKEVTDFTNGKGGRPSVALSASKIHVSFDMGQYAPPGNHGLAYTRDKYFSNNYWETQQQASTSDVVDTKVAVNNNQLFLFYYVSVSFQGDYRTDLYYKTRNINDTNWPSSGTLVKYYGDATNIVKAKLTNNGNLNIIYTDGIYLYWNYYNGSSWGTELQVGNSVMSNSLSFVFNDLFLVSNGGSSVYYRQFNAPPATPVNFNLTTSSASHPYLTWTLNSDPDVYNNSSNGYFLERRLGGNTVPISWSAWSTIATLNGTTSHYEDTYINNASGAGPGVAEYRLKANDNVYDSPYTNSLGIRYGTSSEKIIGSYKDVDVKTYNLLQNFPNPFNPSTEIYYQLPNDGNVKLKVYNIMGQEVMTLVNGFKEKGMYSVSFNAVSFTSGIYIYKLEAGNYVQVKKMILTK